MDCPPGRWDHLLIATRLAEQKHPVPHHHDVVGANCFRSLEQVLGSAELCGCGGVGCQKPMLSRIASVSKDKASTDDGLSDTARSYNATISSCFCGEYPWFLIASALRTKSSASGLFDRSRRLRSLSTSTSRTNNAAAT